MYSNPYNRFTSGLDEPDFKSYDYVIGGKLVVGHASMEETYFELIKTDVDAKAHLKRKLISDLVEFIYENNLAEFTFAKDPYSGTVRVAVRAYLAKDETVKILRVANKIV